MDYPENAVGRGRDCGSELGRVAPPVSADKRIIFQGQSPAGSIVRHLSTGSAPRHRVFLLSPANASGVRGKLLLAGNSQFILAQRLREATVTLGEVFSFISSLYFRGKLAYAERFAAPPPGAEGVHVITPAMGLLSPRTFVDLDNLRTILSGSVDAENILYRGPLERDALKLRAAVGVDTEMVLLGSIATTKYVDPLSEIFGTRLVFPKEFVGRGDMSRGGMLLRCVRADSALTYVPVIGATKTGRRPAKLALRERSA